MNNNKIQSLKIIDTDTLIIRDIVLYKFISMQIQSGIIIIA